ncbi:hypothetical protein TNCV_1643681 [Trichonephila clavipes]|nr:hypothetical protein TNCV_1643681 [Trichonephila clavipes]
MTYAPIKYARKSCSSCKILLLIPSLCKAARGLLVTDLVILNHGQATRTTTELRTSSPNSLTTQTVGRLSLDSSSPPPHGGFSVVLVAATHNTSPESLILTTRLPRAVIITKRFEEELRS